MKSLDGVLKFLSDGKWHSMDEVGERFSLPLEKLDVVLHQFVDMEVLEADWKGERVRITAFGSNILKFPEE